MYVEIVNKHQRAEEFIKLIEEFFPAATIARYEVSTYIDTKGERVISYFSCISHDAVLTLKDNYGGHYDFPIDMFGTIYEM